MLPAVCVDPGALDPNCIENSPREGGVKCGAVLIWAKSEMRLVCYVQGLPLNGKNDCGS